MRYMKRLAAALLAVMMMAAASVTALAVDYTVTIGGHDNCTVDVVYKNDETKTVSSGDPVPKGTILKVTVTPDAGHYLQSVTAGASVKTFTGSPSSAAYTVNVTVSKDVKISAVAFHIGEATLSYDTDPKGGNIAVFSVSEDGSGALAADELLEDGDILETGDIIEVRTTAGVNYALNSLSVSGAVDLIDGSGRYKITQDVRTVRVSATFKSTIVQESSSEPDDSGVTTEAAKPYVIISGYSYGGGSITAGDTFELTMTFNNTSKKLNVENMKVTMELPAEALMLTSSSNSFYVEKLAAGGSVTQTVLVTAKPTADPQSHEIKVSFDYDYLDGEVRKSANTSESIAIPVIQVDRFEVTGIDSESTVMVGEESYLTVNFVNKGRSEVYNISASIDGNIQNPGQQQNLGNLASGATGSADFYITALESGVCSGEITITYEDTNMEEKTVTLPFSTTAQSYEDMYGPSEPTIDPGTDEPSVEPAAGIPWWGYVIGGTAAAAIVVLVVRAKIKKKRSAEEDADL